ncbi:hypothetical protein Goarm_019083 [Gossypium armourianum]|uniref:Uncharacterized protein n=1 Tax=Gossypium armourianum TaxID=34283 RepID=A0A7J9IKA9_9ROSI|nr:hypothetical protein [Gossypium armourianum]
MLKLLLMLQGRRSEQVRYRIHFISHSPYGQRQRPPRTDLRFEM